MGAGYGNGPGQQQCHPPGRGTQTGGQGGGAQERHQSQLRHEHADDVQRVRHLDVAQRRVNWVPPRSAFGASPPGGPSPDEEQSLRTVLRLRGLGGILADRRRWRTGRARSAAAA